MKTKSAAEIDVGDGGGGVRFAMVASTLRRPFRDDFPTYVEGMCRSRPGRFLAPPEFARNARLVRDFQPRRDDIYVMTFPKSGTSLSLSLSLSISSLLSFLLPTVRFPLAFRS